MRQVADQLTPGQPIEVPAGFCPVMVRSNLCNVGNLTSSQMVKYREDELELGGSFILNGLEKVVRLIINPRANFPMAIKRPTYAKRGPMYSDLGVYLRGVRSDGTSTANIMHYVTDGTFTVRLLINRREFYVPLLPLCLALVPMDRNQLFNLLLGGNWSDEWTLSRLEAQATDLDNLVQDPWSDPTKRQAVYKAYCSTIVGNSLREMMDMFATPEDFFDEAINSFLLVHLDNFDSKLNCLAMMFQKLVAVVKKEILPDNQDSFAHHEVSTPGQLFATVFRDACYETLLRVRRSLERDCFLARSKHDAIAYGSPNSEAGRVAAEAILANEAKFKLCFNREANIGNKLNYFISTGNIKTRTADLLQLSGYSVVADRINIYRYLSHFRAVHRGAYFAEMKTTTVRKLLPETWGFLCPVHTPDGAPCGLLLHLAQNCRATVIPCDSSLKSRVRDLLRNSGVKSVAPLMGSPPILAPPPPSKPGQVAVSSNAPVCIDGEVLGYVTMDQIRDVSQKLRSAKLKGELPMETELVAIEKDTQAYPGIFVATHPGRLVRPVFNLASQAVEFIGAMEQPWLNIAVTDNDIKASNKIFSFTEEAHKAAWSLLKQNALGDQKGVALLDQGDAALAADEEKKYLKKLKKEPNALEKFSSATTNLALHKLSGENLPLIENAPVHYTHKELKNTSFLSELAALTPFANHNQSPRNMYQCQMLKQTMAIPFINLPFRTDNKAYRLQTVQKPLVRTHDFNSYGMDSMPSGTNAVVAVIAYTGFDMEDAMILNKASFERGAFHGSVFKTKVVDSCPDPVRTSVADAKHFKFSNLDADGKPNCDSLEDDGTPYIGLKLTKGTVIARVKHSVTQQATKLMYKDEEPAWVEKVAIAAPPDASRVSDLTARISQGMEPVGQKLLLTLRMNRNPIIGDKFASRHGQKGILSLLMPQQDMPFTESGIVPDICFNPHGLPSRMTVGKLIEIIAAKGTSLAGVPKQDATPFTTYPKMVTGNKYIDSDSVKKLRARSRDGKAAIHAELPARLRQMIEEEGLDKNESAADYFGKALLKQGYAYYGTEKLYNGSTGEPIEADIFIGICYYQRLRHMVSDKHQVRSLGPIDSVTRQPVKGRKNHGGVRFGEMERDALIAHGSANLMQDRLLKCSDEHVGQVCPSCGSVLTAYLPMDRIAGGGTMKSGKILNATPAMCTACNVQCKTVKLPYVYRYMCNELSGMNISVSLELTTAGKSAKYSLASRGLRAPSAVPLDVGGALESLKAIKSEDEVEEESSSSESDSEIADVDMESTGDDDSSSSGDASSS